MSVSCPQIFKQPLIDLPPRGCLNIHGALLPRYRGIAPSFWMMAHGEQTAGVTVFFVTRSIDLGDVVEQRQFPILPNETLSQFIVRSKQIACDAPKSGKEEGLGEELQPDLAPACPESAAQPDLAAPFQHRNHHGVGDADAADQQGDRAQPEQQPVEGALGGDFRRQRVRRSRQPSSPRCSSATSRWC